jgi:hypothetical protein
MNEVAMQEELPEFPHNTEKMVPTENRKRVSEKSGTINIVLAIFLSVIFSTFISGALIFSETAKENVLSLFGVSPEQQPDPLLPIHKRIDQLIADHNHAVDLINADLSLLNKALYDTNASKETLTNRIIAIEKNVATFRNETAKKMEAQKQSLIAAQKAKVAAAAKPNEPVNTVSIVSVRGWGNTGFVTLKEGLDYSELLTVGDSWRGWLVLSVDANARKATFRVQDQVKELVM